MKISPGEKLILHMLADLFEHLGVESELDPAFIKSALDGHEWAISSRYGGFERDNSSDQVANEVGEILMMWRVIEERYAELSTDEKARLAALSPIFGEEPKFPGFDGNAGTGHYGTAAFLIRHDFGWDHFKKHYLNSHGSAPVEGQLRMVARFREVQSQKNFEPLSVEDLATILDERVHPENR